VERSRVSLRAGLAETIVWPLPLPGWAPRLERSAWRLVGASSAFQLREFAGPCVGRGAFVTVSLM